MMADGSHLRSGGETWGPVSPNNVHETGVWPGGRSGSPVVAAEARQVERTRRKTCSRAESEFLCPSGMSGDPTPDGVPERVVQATIRLLAEQGPSTIKARTVASASGLSTMAVYHHLGGIAELIRAVADRGFTELDRAFSQVPVTEDPIADLFAMALMTRRVARENPHLYDLMFGLSTRRATYRPLSDSDVRSSGRSRLSGRLRSPR